MRLVIESGKPILGKCGKDKYSYHHPRPKIFSKQLEYIDDIKKQYDMIFQPVTSENPVHPKSIIDTSWLQHVKKYKPIEEINIGSYKLLLFDIDEQEYIINYRYRLLCFIQGTEIPILALNYEWTMQDTCCWGASVEEGHINLGDAPHTVNLLDFRKWALKNISSFIKDINTKILYEKIDKYIPVNYT